MKPHFAVTITKRECAELLEFSIENSLGESEVGGRTLASLISAGTEIASNYRGENFPTNPGYAAVFQVEEIGAQVENIQVGDVALCLGSHRSYQRCDARKLWRVPNDLSAPRATFARLMGVSMSTLVTTTARPGAKVIVVGLGPVGHLAAQVFQACGYQVLACDPVESRRELAAAKGLKVAEKIPVDDENWAGKTALVVECSGHEGAVLDACHVVAKCGEVVLVGVPWRRQTEIFAHELLDVVFHRYVILRSGWEWELPIHPAEFRAGSIQENIETALSWLQENRVQVDGLYAEYSPRDCQQAYQDLVSGNAKSLAAIFDWTHLENSNQ